MEKSIKNLCVITFGLFIFSLSIAVSQICNAAEQTSETKTVAAYLSDLKPIPESSPYLVDKDVEGNPLQINGVQFKKGLCVDTNSELIYRISGKYSTLKVVVGHADAYREYSGKLTFAIYGDGKKIYETKPLSATETEEINVKVDDVGDLALRVNDDGQHSRFVIWGDASLY